MADPRPFGWNPRALRYVAPNGRFVSRLDVRKSIDVALDNASARIRSITQQMRDREITVAVWKRTMQQEIKNVHLYSAAAAKGGWAQLEKKELRQIERIVGKQFAYLDGFAKDLNRKSFPRDGRVLSRSMMYAQAGRNTYHKFDMLLQADSGMTEERNILSPGEACESCIGETDRDWVPIGDLIPIGERTCLANCKCTIEYRDRSGDNSEDDPGEEGPWTGPRPKPGSKTGQVWDLADELTEKYGRLATRQEVVSEIVARGGNPNMASTQYGRWKSTKVPGVTPPPITVPKPPAPKPAAPAPTPPPAPRIPVPVNASERAAANTARLRRIEDDLIRASAQAQAVVDTENATMLALREEYSAALKGFSGTVETRSWDEVNAIQKKIEEQARVVLAAQKAKSEAMLATMRAPEPSRVAMKIKNPTSRQTSAIGKETWNRMLATGKNAIEQLFDRSVLGENFSITANYKKGRAFHRAGQIYIDNSRGSSVVAHEIVHHIEQSRPGLLKKAVDYRASRTAGEVPVRLSKIKPGWGYKADEVTLRDKFSEPYAGKLYREQRYVYGQGMVTSDVDRATEIMTMGVQWMVEDPLEFYRRDKDYFEFIARVMWGE